jgi:hypothetical protein
MESSARDFHTDGPWIHVDLGGGRLSILYGDDGQPGPWDIEYQTESGDRYLASMATIQTSSD